MINEAEVRRVITQNELLTQEVETLKQRLAERVAVEAALRRSLATSTELGWENVSAATAYNSLRELIGFPALDGERTVSIAQDLSTWEFILTVNGNEYRNKNLIHATVDAAKAHAPIPF